MNLRKNFNKIIISMLCAVVIACTSFFVFCFIIKGNEQSKKVYADTVNTNVTYDNTTSLGKFKNGYIYKYSDPSKVDSFRAGTGSSDVTMVTVDTSKAYGTTKENPYVISTTADWEKFVKACGTTGGSAKAYYALANDIDFSSVANVHPVHKFIGTFLGLDHSLKNIKITTWQYWNGSSYTTISASTTSYNGVYGLFRYLAGTCAVTDLVIDNFYYEIPNIHIGTTNVSNSSTPGGIGAGGLVGEISGSSTINILNVHVKGRFKFGGDAGNRWVRSGGISGYQNGATTIYRCSTNIYGDGATSTQRWATVAGIVAQTNGDIKILDSVGVVEGGTTVVSSIAVLQ